MITKIIEIGGNTFAHDSNSAQPRRTAEYYGKSTDTKPAAGVKNGDVFYEMDTKKVWMFDEENAAWLEQ